MLLPIPTQVISKKRLCESLNNTEADHIEAINQESAVKRKINMATLFHMTYL